MNETTNKNAFFHGLRQSLVVTLILLLLCGLVFPILLSGISALIFPSQANGSRYMQMARLWGQKI